VIVGRGAAAILARAPGAFHIFVYASQWRKIKWFEEQFPEHAKEAEQELQATDRRRAAYIRRYFQQDWTDRRLYHLMINSCMGFDAMVKTAIDGAGIIVSEPALK
jgi:cytidylate kinase